MLAEASRAPWTGHYAAQCNFDHFWGEEGAVRVPKVSMKTFSAVITKHMARGSIFLVLLSASGHCFAGERGGDAVCMMFAQAVERNDPGLALCQESMRRKPLLLLVLHGV